MNRKIYVISDTHLGHANILKFTNGDGCLVRPEFSSIKEHDEFILDTWNSIVRPEDIVYHLGDVYFSDPSNVPLLNGRKRLVLGNHDNAKSPNIQNNFQKVLAWRMFPEYNCVLTHVPIHLEADYLGQKYKYNVHGHIHDKPSPTSRHINVSCEAIRYIPQDLEELMGVREEA